MNTAAWHKDQGVGFLRERILRPNHSVVATMSLIWRLGILLNHSRKGVVVFVAYINLLGWSGTDIFEWAYCSMPHNIFLHVDGISYL